MTNPSSLIFVAIVLLWAGWLLQHQIRRRQLLLTARNVETFSEAMRVLERRAPLAMTTSSSDVRPSLRAGAMLRDEHGERAEFTPAAAPAADEMNEVAMKGDSSSSINVGELLERVRRVSRTRRTRGIALLVAAGLFPITLIAVVAGVVAPFALLGSLMLIAAVVLWLRAETVAEAKRAGHTAPARPQVGRPRSAAEATPRQRVGHVSTGRDRVVLDGQRPVVQATVVQAPTPVIVQNDVPFDGDPAPVMPERTELPIGTVESGAPAAEARTAQPANDGTWSPMQVPRPTYTMKAKAPERAQSAAASYENTPVEELPFDGLALNPEEEELPSAFRAG